MSDRRSAPGPHGTNGSRVSADAHARERPPANSPGEDILASIPPPAPGRDALRARILATIETWLDQALTENPRPAGIPDAIWQAVEDPEAGAAPEGCDLHALWSSVTALTQEVKLQGRSFKDMADSVRGLGPLQDDAAQALALQQETAELVRRAASAAGTAAATASEEPDPCAAEDDSAPLVETLLDLRDRLVRGRETADAHLDQLAAGGDASPDAGAPDERFGQLARAAQAVREGYALTLARLEAALERLGIREVPAAGRMFDAQTMNAVDVEETGAQPPGTVTEVYRCGYERDGRMIRVCDVKVARSPTAADGRTGSREQPSHGRREED